MTSLLKEISAHELGVLPLVPLFGGLIIWLICGIDSQKNSAKVNKIRGAVAGWLALFFSASSFLLSVSLFKKLGLSTDALIFKCWDWFEAGGVTVEMAFRFDRLSAVMCLMVTGVGTLIHLFAIGYMSHDRSRARFFTYFNFFLAAMLTLVLGDNLLVLFCGWEGVGLFSYLLIGFWFSDMENSEAGQKAFVINRIGDTALVLAIFLLWILLGSVSFTEIERNLFLLPTYMKELIAGLILIGAIGKSAQLPLSTWLPSAMAGPTPVSALIHAATMVTAGVYLIARMDTLFIEAPIVSALIVLIGLATAFFGATIALVQFDIKKVLAYSTISQLGFMFVALGVHAFSTAIFHIVTHAFFKACLFMAAGSVIYGCHHQQDMRKFGGLWGLMPFTFFAYLCGTLAIAGFPFTSGYYSKEGILYALYTTPGILNQLTLLGLPLAKWFFITLVSIAGLTSFYMTRSLIMTFLGKYKGTSNDSRPHESPWVIWLPLAILSVLALGAGVTLNKFLIDYLDWWTRADLLKPDLHLEKSLAIIATTVGSAGILLALVIYYFEGFALKISQIFPTFYAVFKNKFYLDEFYNGLIVRPIKIFSNFIYEVIDRLFIDSFVSGIAILVGVGGEVLRITQGGRVASYATMMLGACSIIGIFWFVL